VILFRNKDGDSFYKNEIIKKYNNRYLLYEIKKFIRRIAIKYRINCDSYCKRCGISVRDFHVDNHLWEEFNKRKKIKGNVFCYNCFHDMCIIYDIEPPACLKYDKQDRITMKDGYYTVIYFDSENSTWSEKRVKCYNTAICSLEKLFSFIKSKEKDPIITKEHIIGLLDLHLLKMEAEDYLYIGNDQKGDRE